MRQNHHPSEVLRRLPQLLLGLLIAGIGIAVLVASELGLGPWDVLHQGLAGLLGTSIGRAAILTGLLVMLLWIPLREPIGLGSVLNVLLIGLTVDGALAVISTPDSMLLRVVMLLTGPALFALGSSLYIGAGLGSGPRDGVMTGLARRGWPIGAARTGIELTVLALGWSLGGTVGVGTVLFALGVGPMIHVILPRVTMTEAGRAGRPV